MFYELHDDVLLRDDETGEPGALDVWSSERQAWTPYTFAKPMILPTELRPLDDEDPRIGELMQDEGPMQPASALTPDAPAREARRRAPLLVTP